MKTTGHNGKRDHFDILASCKTDFHCKIKETLLIKELQPSLFLMLTLAVRSCCFFSYSFLYLGQTVRTIKLLLRSFFLILVPDPYCKLYKQFSNTVTVTFENVCCLAYETSSLSKCVYLQLSPLFVFYS